MEKSQNKIKQMGAKEGYTDLCAKPRGYYSRNKARSAHRLKRESARRVRRIASKGAGSAVLAGGCYWT